MAARAKIESKGVVPEGVGLPADPFGLQAEPLELRLGNEDIAAAVDFHVPGTDIRWSHDGIFGLLFDVNLDPAT